MRQSLRIVVAAAIAVGAYASAHAGGSASASVKFTGPGTFDVIFGTTRDYLLPDDPGEHGFTLQTSGALFTIANVGVNLPAGGAADYYYDYTITLHDDGLPAERSWTFCVPLSPGGNCGPTPTGNELAAVRLVAGFYDRRSANPYVSITSDGISLSTDGGSFADGVTQSGRLHVHVQSSAPGSVSTGFSVYALATVDANPVSPIPEPASLALMLAGLGVLALKSRLRRA
jgi:hypothetical protein